MLTVSHIALRLSNAPHYATVAEPEAHNYCVYCGVTLSDVTRAIPAYPLVCPISLERKELRQCNDCANIAAALYYYRGNGRTYLPQPKLRGAALDLYVWILRENPQDCWTTIPVPQIATYLRYSRATIAATLTRLCKRGYLEKRPRAGRYREYKPLIWQRPKGE